MRPGELRQVRFRSLVLLMPLLCFVLPSRLRFVLVISRRVLLVPFGVVFRCDRGS